MGAKAKEQTNYCFPLMAGGNFFYLKQKKAEVQWILLDIEIHWLELSVSTGYDPLAFEAWFNNWFLRQVAKLGITNMLGVTVLLSTIEVDMKVENVAAWKAIRSLQEGGYEITFEDANDPNNMEVSVKDETGGTYTYYWNPWNKEKTGAVSLSLT